MVGRHEMSLCVIEHAKKPTTEGSQGQPSPGLHLFVCPTTALLLISASLHDASSVPSPVPGGYIHDSPELPPRSRPPMLAPRGACRGGEVGGLARSGSSALQPSCLDRMAAAEREIRQESRPHTPVRSCPLLTAPTSLPTTLSTPHVAATWTRLKSTSQR